MNDQDQHNEAMERALSVLVQQLHIQGVLPIGQYVTALEQSVAFGKAAWDRPPNPTMDVLLAHFREAASRLDARPFGG